MELIINGEMLQKCGGGSSEYWFCYKDYTIKNISELNTGEKPDDMGQTEYYISIGLIPFITVSNEEIMREFVRINGSVKLNGIFDKVDTDDFIETFWKYYNAYPELKEGLNEFSDEYLTKKLCSWCEENNINYRIEKQ